MFFAFPTVEGGLGYLVPGLTHAMMVYTCIIQVLMVVMYRSRIKLISLLEFSFDNVISHLFFILGHF